MNRDHITYLKDRGPSSPAEVYLSKTMNFRSDLHLTLTYDLPAAEEGKTNAEEGILEMSDLVFIYIYI